MKILMVCPQFFPLVGGYEKFARRLAVELVKRNHNVTVVTERRSKLWAKKERLDNVDVSRIPCIYYPLLHTLSSSISLVLYLLINRSRYDVWHIHEYGTRAAVTIFLGKMLNIPTVLKLTSSGEYGINTVLSLGFLSQVKKHLHKRVSAAVAPTSEISAEAIKLGIPASSVYKIGNGVDTKIFKPINASEKLKFRERFGFSHENLVIFVGRLSAEKNLNFLISAWSKIEYSVKKDWRLIILGDGPMMDECVKFVEQLKLKSEVRFLGMINNVESWLQISDIFTQCSTTEGLSNSMLEAMSCSLPILATRVSGVDDLRISNNAGYVVEQGDESNFALALQELMQSDKRDFFGRNARLVVEDQYSINKVVHEHENLYKKLLNITSLRGN